MLFCPLCHSLLLVQNTINELQFICHTCSYFHPVVSKIKKVKKFENKSEDEIFGQDGKAQKTQGKWFKHKFDLASCNKCGHNEAYFIQMQTRSADEPTTIFFQCVNCGNTWKEN